MSIKIAPYSESLERMRPCMKGFSPPDGAFDPSGNWINTYGIFLLVRERDRPPLTEPRGKVCLTRRTLPDEHVFQLKVECIVGLNDGSSHVTTIESVCASDMLSSPLSWNLTSEIRYAVTNEPLLQSRLKESGRLHKNHLELSLRKSVRTIDVSENVTSNWCLFEAIQRLSEKNISTPDFDMMEDFRFFHSHQNLVSGDPVEVNFSETDMRLNGFYQTGEGILPRCYWRDEKARLLFVIGGVCAYILLDSNTQ